jgi:hypothetical protein
MDSVDKAFWVLPMLGILDVISTLYMRSLGYHPKVLEVGFFARISEASGLVYGFAALYVLGLIALAYVLWYVKGKWLDLQHSADKAVFLLLVVALGVLYVGVTAAFAGNLLLPYVTEGSVSQPVMTLVLYLSTAFSLGLYIWRDVVGWLRTSEAKKK